MHFLHIANLRNPFVSDANSNLVIIEHIRDLESRMTSRLDREQDMLAAILNSVGNIEWTASLDSSKASSSSRTATGQTGEEIGGNQKRAITLQHIFWHLNMIFN